LNPNRQTIGGFMRLTIDEIQQQVDNLILATPTGDNREALTIVNMILLEIMSGGKAIPQMLEKLAGVLG